MCGNESPASNLCRQRKSTRQARQSSSITMSQRMSETAAISPTLAINTNIVISMRAHAAARLSLGPSFRRKVREAGGTSVVRCRVWSAMVRACTCSWKLRLAQSCSVILLATALLACWLFLHSGSGQVLTLSCFLSFQQLSQMLCPQGCGQQHHHEVTHDTCRVAALSCSSTLTREHLEKACAKIG